MGGEEEKQWILLFLWNRNHILRNQLFLYSTIGCSELMLATITLHSLKNTPAIVGEYTLKTHNNIFKCFWNHFVVLKSRRPWLYSCVTLVALVWLDILSFTSWNPWRASCWNFIRIWSLQRCGARFHWSTTCRTRLRASVRWLNSGLCVKWSMCQTWTFRIWKCRK